MRLLKLFVILFFIMMFSFPVSAESDVYHEQYKNSGADKLEENLPDNVRDFFSENGIDLSDYTWVEALTAENVFSHIWSFLSSGAKSPLKTGIAIIATILITSAISGMELKSSAVSASLYACVAVTAAIITVPVYSAVAAGVSALKGIGVFMLSFVPIFAVIVAAGGAAVSSVAMSSILLAAAETVSYISNFAVLPLMGGYLAVAITSSISPVLKRTGIADIIKKLSLWIFGLISTLFLGILSIQTAVSAASDTLVSKTAKFVIGTSVPVAGGILSEALNTVTASAGLLKSSVGVYGAVALAVIILPILVELLIWRLVLAVSAAAGELFSLPQISSLLRSVDAMISLLVGILLLTGSMFIIALSVVISGVKIS